MNVKVGLRDFWVYELWHFLTQQRHTGDVSEIWERHTCHFWSSCSSSYNDTVRVSKSLWEIRSEFGIHTELSMKATVAVSGIWLSMADVMESKHSFV